MTKSSNPALRWFTRNVLLRSELFERVLAMLCANRSLRKAAKLGAVAFQYMQELEEPVERIASVDGYVIKVDIAEARGAESYFFRENNLAWIVPYLVRPGDACIDAGANMGHYACAMAARTGKAGRILAFEPQPRFAAMIEESARRNGWSEFLKVDRRVLWRTSGEKMRLFLSADTHNSGTSSLIRRSGQKREAVEVETITLASALREHELTHVRFMKIDVEGVEYEVCRGGEELFAGDTLDFVLVETRSGERTEKFLTSSGFHRYLIDHEKKCLDAARELAPGHFGDYLFLKKPQEAALRTTSPALFPP